ncbi:ankyrin repeat domain-containing protein 11-like [Ornithodoros turicata]|uniref:ankyrin repeat domain-containing protein 11-like n=1 Tax=Ornithodoros turicata TaxID=34597 RepID=UPI003139F829
MRKNLPQNQTQKGVEKPTSPRLTLRFQSIRSRDEKSSSRAHDLAPSASTASPKYQSYCVTMEARGDVYDLNGKKDELPTSTTSSALHDDSTAEVVSSSSPHCAAESSSEATDTHETSSMTANGSAPDLHSDETATEESTRKRRRSSNDSSNGGSSAPASKQRSRGDKGHPRGPEMDSNVPKKRGGTSSSDTESAQSEVENDADQVAMQAESSNGGSGQVTAGSSPKVPPLKIVLPPSSGGNLEAVEIAGTSGGKERKVSSAKQALPYVVSTAESVDGSPESSGEPAEKERRREETTAERCQRVTRSSHRAALGHDEDGVSEEGHNTSDVHPRKRKLRTREEHSSNATPSSVAVPQQVQHQGEEAAQPAMNGYQLFLNIRRQVQKRRHSMFIVHPKPPQGFKDYLLNRGSYVLEGNPSSRLSVPIIPPPQSLTGTMKDLFVEQESERYKLRLQHLIEREKLVLSAEQEILRVHGRAARAIQNQAVPLSACSILRDEEIYNVLEPEQLCTRSPEFIADKKEDRDKNVRSRYNGRLFLSWLQDVDDKWEKIKESMLLRHHNEAESLHAVQKLDWEWKMKELGLCDVRTAPVIDDICVPMVHVSDDFDLLPA